MRPFDRRTGKNPKKNETCLRSIGPPHSGEPDPNACASMAWVLWREGAREFFFMNQDSTTTLQRLLALAGEAEQILAQTVGAEDVRDAFAIVRGHLDLGRLYGEPINVDDLERLLARIAESIGDAKFRRRYLMRLRTIVGWARLETSETTVVVPPDVATT